MRVKGAETTRSPTRLLEGGVPAALPCWPSPKWRKVWSRSDLGILSSAPDQSLSKEGATFPSLPSEGKEGDWMGVGEVAGVTSLRGGGGAVRTGRRRRLERVRAKACWSPIHPLFPKVPHSEMVRIGGARKHILEVTIVTQQAGWVWTVGVSRQPPLWVSNSGAQIPAFGPVRGIYPYPGAFVFQP